MTEIFVEVLLKNFKHLIESDSNQHLCSCRRTGIEHSQGHMTWLKDLLQSQS